MISKLIKKDNYDLHVYKTDKFKTIEIHVVLSHDKTPKQYVADSFRDLLLLTSKYYKNKRERFIKQEELYNLSLSIRNRSYGRMDSFDYCMNMINPKLVNDDYTEDAIKFCFDIVNNPVFDNSKLKKLKDELRYWSNIAKENPTACAEFKAYDLFFDDSIDKPQFILEDEVIDSLTMEQIQDYYKELISNSKVDIFLLGDVDDKYIEYIDKYNVFKSVNTTLEYQIEVNTRDEVKVVTETRKDLNQAQIYMMFNIPKMNYEDFLKMAMYGDILGKGGLTSRLYKKVREEEKLCYNIGIYNKIDTSSFTISTSVDNKNIDKTIQSISECIDGMQEISDEEIDNEKAYLLPTFENVFDDLRRIFLFDYRELLLKEASYEKSKEIVNAITKEDVLSMNGNLKLNCIYILKGE